MVCGCLFVFFSYASWVLASKAGWGIYLFLNGCSNGLSKLGRNLFISFRPEPNPRLVVHKK
jgi:hypothetical protein